MSPVKRASLESALTSLGRLNALLDSQRLHFWDKEGLTVTQLRLLLFLAEKEGLSNAELAERLFVTRPSVSALLDRLERGGFLRREISPVDRRGISIKLEDRGRRAVSALQPELYDRAAKLLRDASDEDLEALAAASASLADVAAPVRQFELEGE